MKYWAGGFGKDEDAYENLKDFIENNYWAAIYWAKDEKYYEAVYIRRLFKQIEIGDLFLIKGYGGQHDLVVHYIGLVINKDEGKELLDFHKLDVPLYSGHAPEGAGAGNWFRTILEVRRPDVIKLLFADAREKANEYIEKVGYNYLFNKNNIMTADLITATISAGMEAIELWITLKDRFKAKQALDKISVIQNTPENQVEAQNLLLIVPQNILDRFGDRIKRCFDNFDEVLANTGRYLPQEVDEAANALKECVCRELRRLNTVNVGIPDGVLKNYWDKYQCEIKQ